MKEGGEKIAEGEGESANRLKVAKSKVSRKNRDNHECAYSGKIIEGDAFIEREPPGVCGVEKSGEKVLWSAITASKGCIFEGISCIFTLSRIEQSSPKSSPANRTKFSSRYFLTKTLHLP